MATSCKAKRETYFQEPDLIAFFLKVPRELNRLNLIKKKREEQQQQHFQLTDISTVGLILLGRQLEQKKLQKHVEPFFCYLL